MREVQLLAAGFAAGFTISTTGKSSNDQLLKRPWRLNNENCLSEYIDHF